jgi:hypothetical protein
MGNYFSSNKTEIKDESIPISIINEIKEEVTQSEPTPNTIEVETKRSLSAIPEEVVEEINDYFKDHSNNIVSSTTSELIANVNDITRINSEINEVEHMQSESQEETVVQQVQAHESQEKPTQLQLPTKKQKKKKHKTH